MNKPILVAVGVMAALFANLGVGSVHQAFAQLYGGGGGEGAPLSEDQLAFCEQYAINPCTESRILAKERVLGAQSTTYGNDPEGSGTPYFQGDATVAVIAALGAIFGGVAAAFFFKGRGAKQVTT